MAKVTKKVSGIASSFVANQMKLANDRGAGEAKLFIGTIRNENEYDNFFAFDEGYSYKLDRENLLLYLNESKIEYVFQRINKYKKADLDSWNENEKQVSILGDEEFFITLTKFTDASRYYVRAEQDIFKKHMRKIIVPKITDIIFEKDDVKKEITLLLKINYNYESNNENEEDVEITDNIGQNVLYYGVPGAGKSNTIDGIIHNDPYERVVFHPDYTYSDFVGQIMPRLKKDNDGVDKLTYEFVSGPFTKILKRAVKDESKQMHYLVIEEINRGNAPAIFGDLFQLLDRKADGSGKYGITNFDIAREVYDDEEQEIKMPNNLTILATMNTCDQNVFTLDTAFQRRWEMKYIKNDVFSALHAGDVIEGSNVTWGPFADVINKKILEYNSEMSGSEDKQLGAYFATKGDLTKDKFAEKVLKFLWDDAFKLDRNEIFRSDIKSIGELLEAYEKEANSNRDPIKGVMDAEVYKRMMDMTARTIEEAIDESEIFPTVNDANEE